MLVLKAVAVYVYAQLVQLPKPSDTTLFAFLVGFLALIFVATGIEFLRRSGIRRARLSAEWDSIHSMMADRMLTDAEAQMLTHMIKRYSRARPLHAVTTRHGFEQCVSQAMNAAQKKGDRAGFERMGNDLRDIRSRLGLDYVPIGHQIESTRELHPGQWISVALEADAKSKWFRTRVELVDEAYFYLTQHSSSEGLTPDFGANDNVKCRMWRDEDARYFFSVSVVAVEKEPRIWCMAHTDLLRRDQAREHYRIRYNQSATVGVLNAPVDGNLDNIGARPVVTKLRGRITSLSAGGFAVVLQQAVSKQVLLRVPIVIPNENEMNVEATIISCEPVSGGRYLVRAAFVAIDEERRDRLAKFVNRRQQFGIAKASDAE